MGRARNSALMSGQSLGPLHGVPITVKDLTETALRTTSGSVAFADYVGQHDDISWAPQGRRRHPDRQDHHPGIGNARHHRFRADRKNLDPLGRTDPHLWRIQRRCCRLGRRGRGAPGMGI